MTSNGPAACIVVIVSFGVDCPRIIVDAVRVTVTNAIAEITEEFVTLQSGNPKATEHTANRGLHLPVDFSSGLVDCCQDKILQHFDIT